jgi:DNA modification methylase
VSVRILLGDVRDKLAELSSDSVDCVVTSPPYWGLRDYGVDGQLGLERTPGEHVEVMGTVFEEVRRILKPEGTLWLNYGDSYATTANGRSAADTKAAGNDDRTFRDKPFSTVGPVYEANYAKTVRGEFTAGDRMSKIETSGRIMAGGVLKPKDLCGIPWRVAFALQDRGWWLRQDIIWSKPNPMPESIRDRCTKAHEYLFLMAKSERYYFDFEAIQEDAAYPEGAGNKAPYEVPGQRHGENSNLGGSVHKIGAREKRNRRSVWQVNTQPFPEAHFATFPPALIEPCILAGCPEGGTVLDPFFGAGTTGLVADRLQRNCIGIELNPEYAEIAMRRIQGEAGFFADIAIEHTGPRTREAA